MKWQTIRRETGLVEHVCSHGIGHPNFGSAVWLNQHHSENGLVDPEDPAGGWTIHGCDGCCRGGNNFPGTPELSLVHAHGLLRAQNAKIEALEELAVGVEHE